MVQVREDMTGWVMAEHGVPDSKLTVICQADDYVRSNGQHDAQWLCECSCEDHNRIIVRGSSLKSGDKKSCGCLYNATFNKGNKKNLSGEYGIIWSSNTDEEIYFDLDVADKILKYTWYKDTEGYAATTINHKTTRMHVFLGFKWYDHHNRNKLDNRKINMVKCTRQENGRNKDLISSNKSGITGVYWYKRNGRWKAQITLNGKTVCLGTFTHKNDAITARLNAEAKFYGEFAPQRNLFKQYEIQII